MGYVIPAYLEAQDSWMESDAGLDFPLDRQTLSVIGRGLTYPFRFVPGTRGAGVADDTTGFQKINRSIWFILNTLSYSPQDGTGGEYPKNPKFGSRLKALTFEPAATPKFELEAESEIRYSLKTWENRIEVLDILFNYAFLEQHIVGIPIYYTVPAVQRIGNLVYPFYTQGYQSP